MQLRRAYAAAVRHSDRQREGHLPAGAPAIAAHMRDQLVEAGIGEGVVLHLAHRPPARHAEADGGTEDPGLRQRRVDAAVGAEAFAQSSGSPEDAARSPDVLAHDHDVVVPRELRVQRVVDSLDQHEVADARRSCASLAVTHRGPSAGRRGRPRAPGAARRTSARRRAQDRRAPRPRRLRFPPASARGRLPSPARRARR